MLFQIVSAEEAKKKTYSILDVVLPLLGRAVDLTVPEIQILDPGSRILYEKRIGLRPFWR